MRPLIDFANNLADAPADSIEKVVEICRALLDETPNSIVYSYLMGIIECKRGHADSAAVWFGELSKLHPASATLLCQHALTLLVGQRHAEAIALFRQVLELKPDDAVVLYHLGNACKDSAMLDAAVEAYERALAINPDYAEALNNLGNVVKDKGNVVAAKKYYEKAVRLDVENPFYINNLGVIHYMIGDFDGAISLHRRALELRPDYPEALNNIALLERNFGSFDTAALYCRRALRLRPDYPEALNNLGNALKDGGDLGPAVDAYRQAIRLKETDPEVQHNLALALLARGQFDEGWALHEMRWRTRQLAPFRRDFHQPLWQGEAGQGRVLFLHHEQGLGDTLQFCRYAPMAASRGFRVVIEVQAPLVRLMRSLAGVDAVVAHAEAAVPFDVHCPLMSLPGIFRTGAESIPDRTPYLRADGASVAIWRQALGSLQPAKPRVGLVWAGNPRLHSPVLSMTDRRRSMAPALLAPLTRDDRFRFFSLQKDAPQAADALDVIDVMNQCRDFADTAAFVANLDLVVTVDTAVAHLAGALGKPVWVMNRFDSCWRWPRDADATPWYPSMRLFHQPRPGDWESVVAALAGALDAWIGAPAF